MARRKSKLNPQFGPRERFNWGYHDAAHDFKNHRLRYLVSRIPDGANPMRYVLTTYDRNYANGYVEGERDARDGIYAGNSEDAWRRVRC